MAGPPVKRAASSRIQDASWFMDQLAPGSTAHLLCRAYRVSEELDLGALRAAWGELRSRQEILRTVLVAPEGLPVQEIHAEGGPGPSFVECDLTATGTSPEEFFSTWADTPFVLGCGPLARLVCARLGPADHGIVVAAHRAIVDEQSMSILMDELSTCYAAAVSGRPAGEDLPPPRVQYADYARWQRARDQRDLKKWWISELSPVPSPPALPAVRSRPAGFPEHGGVVRFDWDGAVADRLASLSDVEGLRPSAVLLAAFQSLLWRYGDDDRVAVVVPAPVRPSPEFERLVGPCTNPLVLCADFSGGQTFREIAGQVASRATGAFAHGELPFGDLVRALDVSRQPGRLPVSDVLFDCWDQPVTELTVPGAVVSRQAVDSAVFADLALTVEQVKPSVSGTLRYRADLFDHGSVEHLVGQLHTLLGAALAEPDTLIGALALESPDRTRAAVREADRVVTAAEPALPVHELVRGHAENRPESDAVLWDGACLSYRDIDRHATSIAEMLRGHGVEGRAVVVRVAPGPGQYAALLGVLKAGAHLVWFGTGDAGERGHAVLEDLRPACLLLDGDPAADVLAEWYRTELHGRVLDITAADETGNPFRASTDLGELAYIAYTSGSTGKPKGIAQTQAALAQFATWMATEFHIGPDARVAQWVAPEHDPALAEVFAALTSGATLCPPPQRVRAHPERLADWLRDERITHIQLVPSFAKELLRVIAQRAPAERPASLGHVLLMGEVLPAGLANGLREILPGARLVNLYGPTETVAATWHEIDGTVHGPAPIGRPIPGRQVLVLDDLDRPCPAGITGNIVVRSPYVTPGYTGARAGDRAAFLPLPRLREFGVEGGGCYRTGDLGRRRPDGVLEFRGRKDFQVKLAGNRVELSEIETVLAAHDSVAECAVVALTDEQGLAARLVVHVVPRPTPPGETAADARVWRGLLRRSFGTVRLPATFRIRQTPLPRNVAGKVDRRRLPDSGPAPAAEPVASRSEAEQRMAAIWAELLGTDRFGTEDTFFAAGGHSLLIPLLATRVRERFGVRIPLGELLANPTLAGLSVRAGERKPLE